MDNEYSTRLNFLEIWPLKIMRTGLDKMAVIRMKSR